VGPRQACEIISCVVPVTMWTCSIHASRFMPRDAMHKRGLCRRAMSVRPSVTFVYSVKTNNTSSNFCHHQVATSFFSIPNVIPTLPAPNAGVECRWCRQKSRFSTNIWLHRVLSTVRPRNVIHTAAPDVANRRHAGERRRLLYAGDDDEVFMTRSLNVTPTAEQNLIVRSGKSEADVTSTKRLRSRYCTLEANY